MTSKQYLKRKNKLIRKVTGVTLIPKDQIVEHPFIKLNIGKTPIDSLKGIYCTYCQMYHKNSCEGCPMFEADNRCFPYPKDDRPNSWNTANDLWIEKATEEDKLELFNLAKQYNEEEGKKDTKKISIKHLQKVLEQLNLSVNISIKTLDLTHENY